MLRALSRGGISMTSECKLEDRAGVGNAFKKGLKGRKEEKGKVSGLGTEGEVAC